MPKYRATIPTCCSSRCLRRFSISIPVASRIAMRAMKIRSSCLPPQVRWSAFAMAMGRRYAWSMASTIAEHAVKCGKVNRCAALPMVSPMRRILRDCSMAARASKHACPASTASVRRRAELSMAFAPMSHRLWSARNRSTILRFWCCAGMGLGLVPQQVELPDVLMRSIQHRQDREEPGLANASLQVAHLGEFGARFFVDGNVETILAHQQHALGAERELRMKPNVAKQVRDDRTLEAMFE